MKYLALKNPKGTYQYGEYLFKGLEKIPVDSATYEHFSNDPLFLATETQDPVADTKVDQKAVASKETGVMEVSDLPEDHRKKGTKKRA